MDDEQYNEDDAGGAAAAEIPKGVLESCDAVGRLMEFWGFSRHMGRVWALLYFSPEDLPAAELQRLLGLSAGSISNITTGLVRWDVIHERRRPGDRKAYFEAETDLWRMLSRVVADREMNLIRNASRIFESAAEDLDQRAQNLEGAERELAEFRHDRIQGLFTLATMAEGLIETLVEQRLLDLSRLPDALGD